MKWWVVMVVALSDGRRDWYLGMEEGWRVILVLEKGDRDRGKRGARVVVVVVR